MRVAQNNPDYYRQLAEYLNMTLVDLTCLQHEYGIFGGPAGSYILLHFGASGCRSSLPCIRCLPSRTNTRTGCWKKSTGFGVQQIYMVTPYLNPYTNCLRTLAYLLGVGAAVVSTPYWYAEEPLAEERGRLVPFQHSRTLANTIIQLFEQESERHAMRKRAYAFDRRMVWKEVARAYLDTF